MPLRTTLLSVGTFSMLAATSLVSGHRAPVDAAAAAPAPAQSSPALPPASHVDDAVAAAVIESISHQFDTGDVVVQLGKVDVRPASIQDREVVGDGQLRIDGQGEWIPFRFAAMYDTASDEVTYPQLDLQAGAGKAIDRRSALAASLDRQVGKALKTEFQSQPVAWSLAKARVSGIGRFLRVDGEGLADFGADGNTPAQVEGLYDTVAKRWVRVHYELGPGSQWMPEDGAAIASR